MEGALTTLPTNNWIFKKIMLGVALAAPMGPVSIEMIRQGLQSDFLASFSICCGGGIGDLMFLLIAHFGLLKIAHNKRLLSMLGFLGAGFIIYLGMQNYLFDVNLTHAQSAKYSYTIFNNFCLGCGLAIINPISILFWVSLYANISIERNTNNNI